MFLFDSLRAFLPKIDGTTIDNQVFRLHYKLTVAILVAFVILVSSREYIGEPIACTPSYTDIPEKAINQFCWVQATFSMPDAFNVSKVVHEEVPYHGVGLNTKGQKTIHHKYYQWVAFMLFLQAIMFYIPRYLWKMWEGGKMKHLLMELNFPIMDETTREEKLGLLASYFHDNLHTHNGYAFKYFICEILNLVNLIGQLYLTDRFLGWEFLTYGTKVLSYAMTDQIDRVDPMIRVFPRLTKCHFRQFGTGGGVEKRDVLCVLPLNAVNEKIYIFLWFWFITLCVVTCASIIYRIVIFRVRSVQILTLRMRVQMAPIATISTIVEYCHVGDWFVLYLLSKNMHHVTFRKLIDDLVERLGSTKTNEKYNKAYLTGSTDTIL